jgi:hypothetical protein
MKMRSNYKWIENDASIFYNDSRGFNLFGTQHIK